MGRGAAWMIAGRFAEKFLGLLSTFVLARLLLPEHFGIVMIASSIVAALELMGAFSFDTVLIQLQNATREHYDCVWTIGFFFNCFYALILSAGAWWFADFYNDQRLVLALLVIAATRLCVGLANIGVIDFRKNLQFSQDFFYSIAKKIVTISATITAAFVFRDHRALLVGLVIGSVYGLITSYTRHPFRPRFSLRRAGDIFHSASWLFVHNIIYFLNTRSTDFLVAKLAGTQALGVFNLANEVASAPLTEIAAPVNRAAMPAYAKLGQSPSELVKVYQSTQQATALLLLPACVIIATIAPLFVATMLGPNWMQVAELMPILALAALPLALANNTGVVLLALGHSRQNALMSGIRAATLLLGLFLLTFRYGAMGAAYALLVSSLLFLPISYWMLGRYIDISLGSSLRACLRPALASLPSGLLLGLVCSHWAPSLLHLIAALALALGLYLLMLALLWLVAGRPDSHEKAVFLWAYRLLPKNRQRA